MRSLILAIALAAAFCGPAAAGVHGDDLTRCLITKTSVEDRQDFMAFSFIAIAQHPAVRPYSPSTPEQLDYLQGRAASVLERSLTELCRAEAISALRYEGAGVIPTAFQAFGQAATNGLMTDPAVTQGLRGMGEKMDSSKLEALLAESAAN